MFLEILRFCFFERVLEVLTSNLYEVLIKGFKVMILALDYVCFPGKALDFISGWKSFLNFRIFCHLYILVIRNSVSYFQAQEVLASLYVIVVS